MSWSWITKLLEKKVIDEAQKQLNLEIKDGKVEFIDNKQCQFCNEMIAKGEVFCPKCGKCLE